VISRSNQLIAALAESYRNCIRGRPLVVVAVRCRAVSPLTAYLVETLVTLLGVVALAVLVLYGARRLGVGRPGGPIDLVGRLPLDGRRAVYLVRVGEVVYVVGASEAGLTKLGEHPLGDLDLTAASGPPPFRETLQRVLGRGDISTLAAPPSEPKSSAAKSGGASEPNG
jgi:flagellar biogenesis protein FliO